MQMPNANANANASADANANADADADANASYKRKISTKRVWSKKQIYTHTITHNHRTKFALVDRRYVKGWRSPRFPLLFRWGLKEGPSKGYVV